MAKKRREVRPPPTIWKVPDWLWPQAHALILQHDPPARTGRARVDPRPVLDGIIYHLRSGCQWNALPAGFGSDSTVHRTFQRWVEKGLFRALWAFLLQHCEGLGGVDWEWQSADGAMGKARLGGTK